MNQDFKRVRGRARFRTELPLAVRPAELDGGRLEEVLDLFCASEQQRETARESLVSIARSYQHSMRLAADRASRSDMSRTLDALAGECAAVCDHVAELSSSGRNIVDPALSIVLSQHAIGLPALEATAEFFEYVAEELRRFDTGGQTLVAAQRMADLAAKMNSLPMQCQWELVLIQRHAALIPRYPDSISTHDFASLLATRLRQLSRAAAILTKKRRGPLSNSPQMRAVSALRELFERVSGHHAAHHMKKQRVYTGRAETAFGNFAEAAFAVMEPAPKYRRGLVDAIAFELCPSRSQSKARHIERYLAKDERDLEAALSAVGLPNFSPLN